MSRTHREAIAMVEYWGEFPGHEHVVPQFLEGLRLWFDEWIQTATDDEKSGDFDRWTSGVGYDAVDAAGRLTGDKVILVESGFADSEGGEAAVMYAKARLGLPAEQL
ncbi:MAG: hypothetical protein F9B45_31470 [Phycisphaera sp. RhM]|nr:hypothetical protein [Phycisphaera sp. RhM]